MVAIDQASLCLIPDEISSHCVIKDIVGYMMVIYWTKT